MNLDNITKSESKFKQCLNTHRKTINNVIRSVRCKYALPAEFTPELDIEAQLCLGTLVNRLTGNNHPNKPSSYVAVSVRNHLYDFMADQGANIGGPKRGLQRKPFDEPLQVDGEQKPSREYFSAILTTTWLACDDLLDYDILTLRRSGASVKRTAEQLELSRDYVVDRIVAIFRRLPHDMQHIIMNINARMLTPIERYFRKTYR